MTENASATTLAPTPARIWRAARLPLVLGTLIVAIGVLTAALTDRGVRGFLDADAIDESGSRAVAELLRDQGVTVTPTGDTALVAAAAAGSTVVVPFPNALAEPQLAALRDTAADVVLVEPRYTAEEIVPGLVATALTRADDTAIEPGCALPAARAAGPLDLGGGAYDVPGAQVCYPDERGGSVVVARDGGRTVTALGDADPLTNRYVVEDGNAALVLALLGRHAELLWFDPAPSELATGAGRSLEELVPEWVRWTALQLAIVAVLLVLWRARRLGPVVREPLPVVVRASEAVEGRARLYRRAGAREHAAETLRDATRARLRPLVGLSRDASPAELAGAVNERLRHRGRGRGDPGRPDVGPLLYGPPPGDDAGLVALARALDECEGEVRRS